MKIKPNYSCFRCKIQMQMFKLRYKVDPNLQRMVKVYKNKVIYVVEQSMEGVE